MLWIFLELLFIVCLLWFPIYFQIFRKQYDLWLKMKGIEKPDWVQNWHKKSHVTLDVSITIIIHLVCKRTTNNKLATLTYVLHDSFSSYHTPKASLTISQVQQGSKAFSSRCCHIKWRRSIPFFTIVRGFGCVLCSTCVWVCAISFILFFFFANNVIVDFLCYLQIGREGKEEKKCAPYHKCDTHTSSSRGSEWVVVCWRSFKSVIFVSFLSFIHPLLPIKCVIHTLDTLLQAVANLLFSRSHTPSMCALPVCHVL